MDVTSYLLGKKAGGGSAPVLQDKEITITENGTINVTADTGYDGLGEVEVTTNVPTSGPDLSEYFNYTITYGTQTFSGFSPGWRESAKKLPSPLQVQGTNLRYAFYQYPQSSIPKINGISNVTNMEGMFSTCLNIIELDLSDWDTSNVTKFSFMFESCTELKNLNISSFDFSSCQQINNMFANDNKLKNLTFGHDLGKGYLTTASSHYNNYTLNLQNSQGLTHDSLMSVINGLYDIASAGVQTQNLILGSTNLAKLSQAEKDIVTNKGWTLS